MKFIIATLFFLFSTNGYTQDVPLKDSVMGFTDMVSVKDTVILDSFTFCKLRFAIPRDCNKKSQANCCSHNLYPLQVGCNNGKGISWSYYKNEEIARQNFESFAEQMKRQVRKYVREPVECYLLNIKVEGYRLTLTTKENEKWSEIVAYGIINSQPVLVHLNSLKPIRKNKDIQPVLRQIISMEE